MHLLREISFLAVIAVGFSTMAQISQAPPANQTLLGESTYEKSELMKLAHPRLLWADDATLEENGIERNQTLSRWAYAGKVEGEINASYVNETVTGYVSRYGGFDMGFSLGDGRAVILDEKWQSKGARQTEMVSAMSEKGHRNGAAFMAEGILESLWGGLLNHEMPYGAYRTVALIATGSMVTENEKDFFPRVLILREDPIRPAHLLINLTAEKMGTKRDAEHVAWIMNHLLDVLPKPPGLLPTSETERFLLQTREMIDRQAIQHGYAWAHGLLHGAIDAANVGLDGRVLDYGSFSAFDGYPRARMMTSDGISGGYSGDTVDFRETMLKEIYDSWSTTLPKKFRDVLPSKKSWDNRFDVVFARTQREEMLKLAGAFPEITKKLEKTQEGKELSDTLMTIALAGNSEPIEVWKGESPFGRGRYQLPAILRAIANADLADAKQMDGSLIALIPDLSLRSKLISGYRNVFNRQREMVKQYGINFESEQTYRRLATEVRNKKMTDHFRNAENMQEIRDLVSTFARSGDVTAIQSFIDRKIAASRREYHDAKPFTIVVGEKFDNRRSVRKVFDAKTGKLSNQREFSGREKMCMKLWG